MAKRIITISREFGSGGHSIGKAVAEQLGITFYDRELLKVIAKNTGYAPEIVEAMGEDAAMTNSFLYRLALNPSHMTDPREVPANKIYLEQHRLLTELADKEPCVIVGRCGDYVLRDRTDCLNVFIYADVESRAKRILERYGETDIPIDRRIADKDKRRKVYYEHFTDRKWGNAYNYHLALDSSLFGTENCIDTIIRLCQNT